MLPKTSRIWMYRFPFGYAARATRTVSWGTGQIACGFSDIDTLLWAILHLLFLPFLASLFLYRQGLWDSPAVSHFITYPPCRESGRATARVASIGVNLSRCSRAYLSPRQDATRVARRHAVECHPWLREGSDSLDTEILRRAQDDRRGWTVSVAQLTLLGAL